ncbi:MAG: hypothetical protein AVDCRST_MAG58-2078 [uncultured Rubrobacteraceae bacterium]|uniref:Uncharacterized protein n=1 Tax=uncultured Rubrobacteraceae bacterium TaxID=349277 RepID=A0A6J4QQ23_9ACTN|nr:MAG: hypothetical protein AVDCRST_MAG58-2078 [uncultured Rubrobacteraceae bacterium]
MRVFLLIRLAGCGGMPVLRLEAEEQSLQNDELSSEDANPT